MNRVTLLAVTVLLVPTSWAPAADNALTDQEKQEGWLLLFDGQTTKGWISLSDKPLTEDHVQDGSLNPHPCHYMLT